jgi:Subtilisin inhibitor-like
VTIYTGTAYTLTLRCEPDGGTVPDPASACAQLLADPGLLEPQPVGRVTACPMIMAGSGRAVVDGSYLGRRVDETIVDGGCDLQRWAELMQVIRSTSSDLQPVNPGYPAVPSRA